MFTKEECERIIYLAQSSLVDSKLYFKYDDNIKYKVSNIKKDETTDWIFDKMLVFFTNRTGIKIKKSLNILKISHIRSKISIKIAILLNWLIAGRQYIKQKLKNLIILLWN